MHKCTFRLLSFFYPLFFIYITFILCLLVQYAAQNENSVLPYSDKHHSCFGNFSLSKWLRYGAFLSSFSAVEVKFCENKQAKKNKLTREKTLHKQKTV